MVQSLLKRCFDLAAASVLIVLLSIPLLVTALIVKFTSPGPVLHWSKRIGIDNRIFKMPKFRTMVIDTPDVATHLLQDPERYLTAPGTFLRKYSLDEIPQLWSILKGDMSFVGPRPALYNQEDLIGLRTAKGIHKLVPGITGWAQINGRDDLPIPQKVQYEEIYLKNRSFLFDLKILYLTFLKVVRAEGVKH
ncbi:MAG: sugar transferase [Syntrophaceae bacterium]